MKKEHLLPILLMFFMSTRGQEDDIHFRLLRQDDDVSVLKEKQGKSLYDRTKWIPLGHRASLSFGGSYRFQSEGFVNEQFVREDEQSDVWFLNRFMFHGHLRLGKSFELFGEVNSSTITSKDNLAPVDRDELSINQLFIKYRFNDHWVLAMGRQNFRLGSGRLVDVREGPNVRLSFDRLALQYDDGKTAILGFFGIPVQQQPGIFDNDFLEFAESLGGFYVTKRWGESVNFDFYTLYKREDNKAWNAGIADDQRVSLGIRHFGTWKAFSFDNEFVYQNGNFGAGNISAWTASMNIAHPVQLFRQKMVLGVKTEAISGDRDPNDNTLGTFDALYPRGAYFGRVARFGPSNLLDIHPYINGRLGKFYYELDYDAFWRFSNEDGVYNPALILEYPSLNGERFIAQQIGTITGLELNTHFALELETNLIFPGTFLEQSGLADTLFHSVLTLEFKF